MAIVTSHESCRQFTPAFALHADPVDRVAVFANQGLAAVKPLDIPALGLLDALAFDPLRTFGALDTLTFDALRTLCPLDLLAFDTLRTFCALHMLAFYALRALCTLGALTLNVLRPLGALVALALRTLRTLGSLRTLTTLDALAFRTLWTFSPLTLSTLRTFRTLGALRLSLAAALARLSATFTVMGFAFGTCRAGQRHGSDTSNQEKLASHYNLLAQSNVIGYQPPKVGLVPVRGMNRGVNQLD